MDNTFPPGGSFPQQPQNNPPIAGVPEVPPKQTVTVRTMDSDLKSISRGESVPVPETVMAPEGKKDFVFTPETQNQMAAQQVAEEEEMHDAKGKKMFIWIGSVVGILVLVAVGYFVVYPLLFPKAPPTPPAPPPPPPVVLAPHASYFVTPATTKTSIPLSDVSSLSISSAWQPLTVSTPVNGTLQEVEIQNPQTGQVPFSQYIDAFGAGIIAADAAAWFEDDFTAFAYYDANGVWPGYIAKLKTGVTKEQVMTGLVALETADLSKLYLFPPGPAKGAFKAGKINNKDSRYAVFTASGAAFNYGVLDSYLLLSTSYEGAKKAATLLGF